MDEITKRVLLSLHPNQDSRHSTPASAMIDLHYAQLALIERWTWERFTRLAAFLRLTHYELASLVLMPHKWIGRWPRTNILPIPREQGAYAQAMLLTLLEARVLENWSHDIIKQPFPTSDSYSNG